MNDHGSNVVAEIVMAVAVASLVVPIAVAVIAVVLLAELVRAIILSALRLIQGPPEVRAVRRIDHDREAAVRELLSIRQDAARRMRSIIDEDVIDGHGHDV
jgi:hypothetical protein